jgi:hypothetical protein
VDAEVGVGKLKAGGSVLDVSPEDGIVRVRFACEARPGNDGDDLFRRGKPDGDDREGERSIGDAIEFFLACLLLLLLLLLPLLLLLFPLLLPFELPVPLLMLVLLLLPLLLLAPAAADHLALLQSKPLLISPMSVQAEKASNKGPTIKLMKPFCDDAVLVGTSRLQNGEIGKPSDRSKSP